MIPQLRPEPPWLRDELWRRARMVPSLDLRPAETQSLRDWVSGRDLVTFTRASNGTRVTSAGGIETLGNDVPRFTFDPVTGRCLGLLPEAARTNLLLRSEEFNTSWTLSGVQAFGSGSVANATTAPDGTTTADKIVETSGGTTHLIAQASTIVSATAYTISIFAKAAERSRVGVYFGGAGGSAQGVVINLNTGGFVGNIVAPPTAYTVTPFPNGWYRITVTSTSTGTAGSPSFYVCNDAGAFSYSGDGTSGIFLWGAMLEAGGTATSYVRTEGLQVARAADIATILSGLDLNTIRGMYAEFINPASGMRGVASLNDNTGNERIELATSGTDPLLTVVDGGVAQASIDAGTFAANSITRLAARFGPNDLAVSVNGGAEVVDTSGTMPTVDRLMIGRTQASEYLNGPLARLVLFDRPPMLLQELTR